MNSEVMEAASADSTDKPMSEKRQRLQGLLLLMMIGVPMLLAYLIFKTGFAMPTSTVNKGSLLAPATSISEVVVTNQKGEAVNLLEGKKKWRMVLVADNNCDDICRQQLYLSRQVHKRLNDKAIRVERVLLNTSPSYSDEFLAFLGREHQYLKTHHVSASQWQDALAPTNAAGQTANGHHIYYMDQEGFLMMSYNAEHEGADLLTDIKRLLRYSYED